MKKSFILTAFCLTAAMCLSTADATDVLTVKTGESSSGIALAEISKLTFGEGKLLVYTSNAETPKEFALDAIQSMEFGEDSTQGITVTNAGNKLDIKFRDGILTGNGVAGAKVAVYSAGGQRVAAEKNWNGSPLSLQHLASGMYVLTINNQTIKFVKK